MWARMIFGGLLAISGVIWTLQGLVGDEADGGMNGNAAWAIIGPIVAVIGVFLFVRGWQMRQKAKAEQATSAGS
jgi:uncharacterized membrane protein